MLSESVPFACMYQSKHKQIHAHFLTQIAVPIFLFEKLAGCIHHSLCTDVGIMKDDMRSFLLSLDEGCCPFPFHVYTLVIFKSTNNEQTI